MNQQDAGGNSLFDPDELVVGRSAIIMGNLRRGSFAGHDRYCNIHLYASVGSAHRVPPQNARSSSEMASATKSGCRYPDRRHTPSVHGSLVDITTTQRRGRKTMRRGESISMVRVTRYRVAGRDSIADWVAFGGFVSEDAVGRGRSSALIDCRLRSNGRCDHWRAVHLMDGSAALTICAPLRRPTRSGI